MAPEHWAVGASTLGPTEGAVGYPRPRMGSPGVTPACWGSLTKRLLSGPRPEHNHAHLLPGVCKGTWAAALPFGAFQLNWSLQEHPREASKARRRDGRSVGEAAGKGQASPEPAAP